MAAGVRYPEGSQAARHVYLLLCYHADQRSARTRPLPARWLAEESALRRWTIYEALRELEKAGRIKRHAQPGKSPAFELIGYAQ